MAPREGMTTSAVPPRGRTLTRLLASIVLAVLLCIPIILITPNASPDPENADNGDSTRTVYWNMTEPASYVLYNTSVVGGFGALEQVNETIEESSTDQYLLGTRTNLDLEMVPDAMVMENSSVPMQTLILQPGPEGMDNYMDEWFPYWTPPDGSDLDIDCGYDPLEVYNKRSTIIMQFNLSLVPAGAMIDEATLMLFETGGKVTPISYTIHAVNKSWREDGVSWVTRDLTHSWDELGGDYSTEVFASGIIDGVNGWKHFDLTRLVDLWTRETIPNYGFVIVAEPEDVDGLKAFTDCETTNKLEQRPILMVNYTLGGASATYESIPLGPGTNATFTLSSWSHSVISEATDEFDTGNISARWEWTNDPSLSGGSVNFDLPGWMNVTGSFPTSLINESIGCNYLHQTVTGDFLADTRLRTYFSADSMGAGILAKIKDGSWLALYLSGVDGDKFVVAKEHNQAGTTTIGSIPWADGPVWLRMERDGDSYQLLASADGIDWSEVGDYSPQYDMTLKLELGLCVFSDGATSSPVVEFEFMRIEPIGQNPVIEMRVRTGNSTNLADPSWMPWGAAVGPSSGFVVNSTGRYIQYQATLTTEWCWLSPVFSGFHCHDERYLENGTITTAELSLVDLHQWENMTIIQTVTGGSVAYYYSTDHGVSWVTLGVGSSFSLMESNSSMIVRMELLTYDTHLTPIIDSVQVVYTVSIASFTVQAPSSVVAGQQFEVTVEARDPLGGIATGWSGEVQLEARDATGTSAASDELYWTSVLTDSGIGVVHDQRYDIAEVITIHASAGNAWGVSAPITVVPGPVASITLEPGNTSMYDHTSEVFSATAYDALGNHIVGAPFSWTAQQSLGVLNASSGPAVLLSVGAYDTGGYLTVSSGTVTVSRLIDVVASRQAPVYSSPIPNQIKPEDYGEWTLDIAEFVSDAEDLDTMLRWYATNESVVEVFGENRTGSLIITFSTLPNVYGVNILTLFVVDSDGMRTTTTIYVEIQSVNDAPIIDHIDSLTVHYDVPYVYDLTYYVSDPDNSLQELVLSVDDDSASFVTVAGFRITMIFPESMLYSTHRLVLMVTDPGDLSATSALDVTVSDDNVPVQIADLPPQTMYQGSVLEDCIHLPDYFTDPDGDVLYYALGTEHVTVDIKEDDSVDLTAPEDWSGVEYVIIQAIDPSRARAEGVMQVTVLEVAKPCSIDNVPDLTVLHDERYEFDLSPYITDLDDAFSDLVLTASDPHCSLMGTVMSVLYPLAMLNTVNPVKITVSDESSSDYCWINITVSDNSPPDLRQGYVLQDHTFQEDLPVDYPKTQGLEYYFWDEEDLQELNFYAFSLSPDVNATSFESDESLWKVSFETAPDFYGTCVFVVRAIDSMGAIFEEHISLVIVPVADAPEMDLPDTVETIEGQQTIISIRDYVTDPDSSFERGDFTLAVRVLIAEGNREDYLANIGELPGALVLQYPEGFLNSHEPAFLLEVSVTDESGKVAKDEIQIHIAEAPNPILSDDNTVLWMGIVLAIIGGASGMTAVAWVRRKKPFIVLDLMLIHNDGFLINRFAHHHEGEIDENILSGMLTAVLGFVEDSMSSQHDDLRSFGFRDYKVAVERGERCFAAVVYEGDAPETLDKALKEFLGTVDRIYKKKLAQWTGDIDTDFAGIEVLMHAWVKENSKKRTNGDSAIWKIGGARKSRSVKPKKVTVDTATGKTVDSSEGKTPEQPA